MELPAQQLQHQNQQPTENRVNDIRPSDNMPRGSDNIPRGSSSGGPTDIIVKGIPIETTQSDIKNRFGEFGEIKGINLKSGFCFINYVNSGSAMEAVDNKHERMFDENHKMIVDLCDERRNSRPFMNNRGGDRGGDRGGFQNNRGGDRMGMGGRGPGANDTCHNCQGTGHWANQCKEERKPR